MRYNAVHYELNNGVKIVRLDRRSYQMLVGDMERRIVISIDRKEVVYLLRVAKEKGLKIVDITRWVDGKYAEYPR